MICPDASADVEERDVNSRIIRTIGQCDPAIGDEVLPLSAVVAAISTATQSH
jgi:hypothetical protein